ncbi:MAG: tripartite tricarboxylate transporter TctB family protein [Microbacteriaceae bacterium]
MSSPHSQGVSGNTPGTLKKTGFFELLLGNVRTHGFGEYLFVLFTIGLGLITLFGALSIELSGSADTFGPRSFPFLVAILLIGSGIMVLIDLFRGRRGQADDGEDIDLSSKTDWLVVLKIVAFFIIHTLLIRVIGWWLAAAILFIGAAWALGAKKLGRTAIIGLALGLIIQIAFGVGLGLSLPPGPLLDWIPFFRG